MALLATLEQPILALISFTRKARGSGLRETLPEIFAHRQPCAITRADARPGTERKNPALRPGPEAADADLHTVFRHEPGLQFGKRRIGFARNAGAKSSVMRGGNDEVLARIEEEAKLFASALQTEEARSALKNFFDKGRSPGPGIR